MVINEKVVEIFKSVDLSKAVLADGRWYVGPDDVLKQISLLENLCTRLKSKDLLSLYNKREAYDGKHDDDISHSGRYFAYFLYELKGMTPEEKKANLEELLSDIISEFGYDTMIKYIPDIQKGRQITESLSLRPENEDYPSYFSKTRLSYAEKMSVEEIPKAIIAGIRKDQETILNDFDWTVVYTEESLPEKISGLTEFCGTIFAVSEKAKKDLEPFSDLWRITLDAGVDNMYTVSISHDGQYPIDEYNPFGRYYAYSRAELKGLNTQERYSNLEKLFPDKLFTSLGSSCNTFFPEVVNGMPVTQPLSIRPDNDEYHSYYNRKKVEEGKLRVQKQVLYQLQASIFEAVEGKIGKLRKLIVLSCK